MKNLKPFDLQAALSGKAVMLRDGRKAYVRHHETELDAPADLRLLGYRDDGDIVTSWCADGRYVQSVSGFESPHDIIGMYPETRVINGFEVPAPETEELEHNTRYYLASPNARHFDACATWGGYDIEKLWLKRGLVFLNKEDAIANAKAMLGIDPYEGDE